MSNSFPHSKFKSQGERVAGLVEARACPRARREAEGRCLQDVSCVGDVTPVLHTGEL